MSTSKKALSFGVGLVSAVASFAFAQPAFATGDGITAVTGGSVPGSLSVSYIDATVSAPALIWILPASTNPPDCSFSAWYAAAGNTFDFQSVYPLTGSPMQITSGTTFGGNPFTITPGVSYVVCMNDSNNAYGTPVVGTATAAAPSPGVSGSAPAPIIQEFGAPVSGTCASAAPPTLNWGGVPGGGWGLSWAKWLNGGRGGAVCTRTLVFSTSQGMWVLG